MTATPALPALLVRVPRAADPSRKDTLAARYPFWVRALRRLPALRAGLRHGHPGVGAGQGDRASNGPRGLHGLRAPRVAPPDRPASERASDWAETHAPLTPAALVATCALLLASCTGRPPPPTLDTVGVFDLCLCATAEPTRDNRGQCLAELRRRGLSCDGTEWSAYWARRRR